MAHGFANIQKPLLIKGWLLHENRKYYRAKDKAYVLESLGMTLNMWVAIASERLKVDSSEETIDGAFALIVGLDPELMEKPKLEALMWLHNLRHSDKYYIEYIHRLEGLVKQKINQSRHADLCGMIQNTWEYKRWMEEAGYLQVGVNLIDNYLHPLADVKTVNGEECINAWCFASLMAGTVTGRFVEGGDPETVSTLR